MDWFLYDNDLRYERVKLTKYIRNLITIKNYQQCKK